VRSWLAIAAFAVFAFNAITMGSGALGYEGDPPNQTVIGDASVMGLYSLMRTLFFGMALLSLAVIEWPKVVAAVKAWFEDIRPGG